MSVSITEQLYMIMLGLRLYLNLQENRWDETCEKWLVLLLQILIFLEKNWLNKTTHYIRVNEVVCYPTLEIAFDFAALVFKSFSYLITKLKVKQSTEEN